MAGTPNVDANATQPVPPPMTESERAAGEERLRALEEVLDRAQVWKNIQEELAAFERAGVAPPAELVLASEGAGALQMTPEQAAAYNSWVARKQQGLSTRPPGPNDKLERE